MQSNDMGTKKYRFTGETMEYDGIILHRIQALVDFFEVKAGDLGGWIEKEENLSQEGECWVYDESKALGDSKISGITFVSENSIIIDSEISEHAIVSNSKVTSCSIVTGGTMVSGSKISGESYLNCHTIQKCELDNVRAVGDTSMFETYLECRAENTYSNVIVNRNSIALESDNNKVEIRFDWDGQLIGENSVKSPYEECDIESMTNKL